ncbi:MAG TPA: DUF2892 domain-containing protein [Gammaproteobacteria bacterium]|nr:DUF2892 domain-containing protein [Gammaproteobacteria bacterium]
MTPNVGKVDKILRIVIGLALLSLLFILEGNAKYWGLLGIVLIATAVINWCPGWAVLGVNTRKHEHKPAQS